MRYFKYTNIDIVNIFYNLLIDFSVCVIFSHWIGLLSFPLMLIAFRIPIHCTFHSKHIIEPIKHRHIGYLGWTYFFMTSTLPKDPNFKWCL